MRRLHAHALAAAAAATMVAVHSASAQDTARVVANGGIAVAGWTGRIDAREAASGQKLENARLAQDDSALHATTGPALAFWHPGNRARGEYTVRATFREPGYMSLNNHPHPYGIFIGGSEMGTERQRYLYCAAYGNGSFIVRGFGPEAFQLNGRRESHEAINKAAGKGEPVTQEIAVHVRADRVECEINGTVVGTYPRSDVVGDGKLASTDGVYGLRFGHNTEAFVTGLTMTPASR